MVILIIAVLFAFGETAYFGFNPHPASFAEWVCDMIALFLGFLGVCRIGYSRGQDAAKKEYEAKTFGEDINLRFSCFDSSTLRI